MLKIVRNTDDIIYAILDTRNIWHTLFGAFLNLIRIGIGDILQYLTYCIYDAILTRCLIVFECVQVFD